MSSACRGRTQRMCVSGSTLKWIGAMHNGPLYQAGWNPLAKRQRCPFTNMQTGSPSEPPLPPPPTHPPIHPSSPLSITTSLLTPYHPLTQRSWAAWRALSAWRGWEVVVAGGEKGREGPEPPRQPPLSICLPQASQPAHHRPPRCSASLFSGPSGTGGPASPSARHM